MVFRSDNRRMFLPQRFALHVLGLLIAAVNGQILELYKLASFSLVLDVDKTDNALIPFQDRLTIVVQQHLTDFFKNKVEAESSGDRQIQNVNLSSTYIWKEVSQVNDDDMIQGKYEVRSSFDLQIEVAYTASDDKIPPRLSESIMNLHLIEAFKGDNYWELVHLFLMDDVLDEITGVQITVMADGFVQYNAQDRSDLDGYQTSGEWNPAMTVGVIIACLLVFSLAVMWSYICCFMGDGTWIQFGKSRRKSYFEKPDSATDDMNSTSSVNPDDHHEDQWMDQWAESMTSIPLRSPIKTRKSKKKVIRHPAQHHNSYLNSIEEADDECSTVCSVSSARPTKSDDRTTISTENDSTRIGIEQDSQPLQQSHRDSSGSTVDSEFSSSTTPFDFRATMPQLEIITENETV